MRQHMSQAPVLRLAPAPARNHVSATLAQPAIDTADGSSPGPEPEHDDADQEEIRDVAIPDRLQSFGPAGAQHALDDDDPDK
jgi:hypothetical protein